MVQFLDFTCPKPYKMYTDFQACLKIATNASKLGMVRHLEIRYHLVRCIVLSGDIVLEYCITEDMLADLFTKIVATSQDKRLSIRFYNDCVMRWYSGIGSFGRTSIEMNTKRSGCLRRDPRYLCRQYMYTVLHMHLYMYFLRMHLWSLRMHLWSVGMHLQRATSFNIMEEWHEISMIILTGLYLNQ